jgi:uncharacterized protein YjbI with pentapeptide repeats
MGKDTDTLNELIEKIRSGALEGTLEITVTHNGKENKILVKSIKQEPSVEINEQVNNIQKQNVNLEKPEIKNIDFSRLNLAGSNFSGMVFENVNFSYARFEYSNLSNTDLTNANFYKASLSRTDMSNAYGVQIGSAYVTGSVNFYNTHFSNQSSGINPLDANRMRENADFVY